MNMPKQLLTALLLTACACTAMAQKKQAVVEEPKDPNEMVAYLFTYFNSNDPKDEQICYALSDDGYNYTPLNDGMPVIESDTIALTQCVRDPHILRCQDGKTFYMVATDMRSALGWSSNRGMVLLKSTDLIHWQHSTVNFPTRYTKTWKNVIRVWAPETIYDHKAGKYMVFYSLRTSDPKSYDKIYYQYANKDFTDLEGEPQWLFDAGNATIDGDIVYNEADQLYHLFYKQESGRGIYQAVAKQLTDKWQMLDGNVEQTKEAVEGVGVCKAIDGKSWIIMYDCYGNGHYQFCRSEDLKTFQLCAEHGDAGQVHAAPRHHHPHHPRREGTPAPGLPQPPAAHPHGLPCRPRGALLHQDREILHLLHHRRHARLGRPRLQRLLVRQPHRLARRGQDARRQGRPGALGHGQRLGTVHHRAESG